jgi:WD40 repeat protein
VFSGRTPELSLGSGISAASWGAGGRYVVTGERDGIVTVFDGRSGKRLASSSGPRAPVVFTAMSEDAHYLAAMAASGSVTLWDLRTRNVHPPSSLCPGGQGRMLFSPDATRLLTYGVEGCGFQLWNAASGAPVRGFGSPTTLSDPRAPATEAAFSSDSGYLVLAGEVADVRDASTGAPPGGTADQYLGHGGPVDAVSFTPDGLHVASSGADGTIRVWDPANPTATLATLRANGGTSATLASAGGGKIVSVDLDGTAARVWDSGLPHPVAQLGNAQSETASLSPDGRLAIAEDQAGGLAVFDPRSGRRREELPGSRSLALARGDFDPIDAGLANNGQLAYDRSRTSVELWRTGDGASLRLASRAGSTPTAVWPAAAAAHSRSTPAVATTIVSR